MSVVEEFSGIDVDDTVYVAVEKEETVFLTCFCRCVRSGLAIGMCWRQ